MCNIQVLIFHKKFRCFISYQFVHTELLNMSGDWAGHRECHILPDWLLVYRIEDDVLVLTLARTGTHSDLFGK